jgi:hypothetical protein
MEAAMPVDSPYYTPDVPDDQKQAVAALAAQIRRKHGIDSAALLLTDAAFSEEQVIDASFLCSLRSGPPEATSQFPAISTLEALVSQCGNIIVLPEWLIDIYGAAHGDRGAASRRVKHLVERLDRVIHPGMFGRPAQELRMRPDEARQVVMADAFLEVLSYRNEELEMESAEDQVRLQYPDGMRETASPKEFGEYVLWRWAEVEAIRATMAQLSLTPYSPVILIEAIPPEGEPAHLWMQPPSEHLVLPRRPGGRSVGTDEFGGTPGGFLARVREPIQELLAKGQYPSMARVAAQTGLSEDTLSRGRIKHRYPSWRAVIDEVDQS